MEIWGLEGKGSALRFLELFSKVKNNLSPFHFFRGIKREKRNESQYSSVFTLAKKKTSTVKKNGFACSGSCLLVWLFFSLLWDTLYLYQFSVNCLHMSLQAEGINLQRSNSWSHDPFPSSHFALTALARFESQFLTFLSLKMYYQ